MKVLVTGASGFVGRRVLAPLVERGCEVHAVGRRSVADAPDEVRWHAAELLDAGARDELVHAVGASHLLHLAWYAEPGKYWTASENVPWVSATGGLLEAFAAAGGGRAVLAGTCAEYAWEPGGRLREDATPLGPATLYGVCKDAARRVAESLGAQLGLSVAWGRIFFLHGPGEHPDRLVASVARALVAGRRAPVSEGRQVRDFLHVDDVAGAFASVLAADVTGPVNVGSGEGIAVRDLVGRLAALAGREDLLDVGAVPTRPGEPAELVADVARLQGAGFAPRYGLDDGLARTLDYWRARTRSAQAPT